MSRRSVFPAAPASVLPTAPRGLTMSRLGGTVRTCARHSSFGSISTRSCPGIFNDTEMLMASSARCGRPAVDQLAVLLASRPAKAHRAARTIRSAIDQHHKPVMRPGHRAATARWKPTRCSGRPCADLQIAGACGGSRRNTPLPHGVRLRASAAPVVAGKPSGSGTIDEQPAGALAQAGIPVAPVLPADAKIITARSQFPSRLKYLYDIAQKRTGGVRLSVTSLEGVDRGRTIRMLKNTGRTLRQRLYCRRDDRGGLGP